MLAYWSVPNQLIHWLHYGLAFTVLFLLWPRVLFTRSRGNWLDQTIANYIKMVCLVVVMGYILVALKLYEDIAILAVLIVLSFRKVFHSELKKDLTRVRLVAGFYDLLDGRLSVRQWLRGSAVAKPADEASLSANMRERFPFHRVNALLLLVVAAVAAYLRLDNAVLHPAPDMSDGYVTLAWMKYIDERILFHDGIYPQGFHIYLATIGKFAFIDPLYILKYTGPLDTLFIALGLYYAVSRFTNRAIGGLLAALLYGVAGYLWLAGDWPRQAATNSQEFAFLFVMPTLYFLYRYLRDGEQTDFWTGLSGVAVVGLVHTLAFAFLGLGVVCLLLSSLIVCFRAWLARVGRLLWSGCIVIAVSVLPLGLGLAMGRSLNRSSAQFAAGSVSGQVYAPMLHAWDLAAAASVIVLLLGTAIDGLVRRVPHPEWLFSALFVGGTFTLYEFGGVWTHNAVIVSRAADLWAIAAPFGIGMAATAIAMPVTALVRSAWLETAAGGVLVTVILLSSSLQPIVPYKMQWDESTNEYLAISTAFDHQAWMMVGPETEYALVLGQGYHLSLGQFCQRYDPTKAPLTLRGAAKPDPQTAKDVFIFDSRPLFKVSRSNSIYPLETPLYRQEEANLRAFDRWKQQYNQAHPSHPLAVYYQGPHLTVYWFSNQAAVSQP